MRKIVFLGLLVALFLSWSNVSYALDPECDPLDLLYNLDLCYQLTTGASTVSDATDVFEILRYIGGFLIAVAAVISGIVIIVAGLVYMSAGSNQTRVTSAKAIFKNGVIGALILFASGIIVSTISYLGTDPTGFFS